MQIAIVVSDPQDWTAQALLASFSKKGIDAFFLNFSELAAGINSGQSFSCSGIDLLNLDALVVRDLGRRGASDVAFRFETLQALQERGISVINPPQAIARAANKFATSRALHDAGVATPRTFVTTSLKEAEKALHDFKKAVSKPLFGYKGRDIVLLEDGVEADLARLKSILESAGAGLPAGVHRPRFSPRHPGLCGGRKSSGRHLSRRPSRPVDQQPGPRRPGGRLSSHQGAGGAGSKGGKGSGRRLLRRGSPGDRARALVIEVNGTPSGKGIFEALGVDVTEAIAKPCASKLLSTWPLT